MAGCGSDFFNGVDLKSGVAIFAENRNATARERRERRVNVSTTTRTPQPEHIKIIESIFLN